MPFPFADGIDSHVLDELIGGPAAALTAVALVVAPGARASGWGARAAAALAARWRGPRRVLLADLDLDRPTLHEEAGIANDEGVIDLIEYGISVSRVIGTGAAGTYDILPAGSYTPDPGAILRHDGWSRVLLEVAARRGTLLAWVPSDADGVEAVVEWAGAVLVLAEAGEGRDVVERLRHPYAVLGILTPAVAPAAAPLAPEPRPTEDDLPATESAPPEMMADFDDDSAVVAGPIDEPTDSTITDHEAAVETAAEGVTEAEVLESLEIGAREAEQTAAQDNGGISIGTPHAAEPAAGDAGIGTSAADSAEPEVPVSRGPADTAAPEATPADSVAEVAAREEEELEERLENDPSARDVLAHEIQERQRAARLAGAAPAAHGIPGVAAAAAADRAAEAAAAEAYGTAAMTEGAAIAHAGTAPDERAIGDAPAADAPAAADATAADAAAAPHAADAAVASAALDDTHPPAPAAADLQPTEAAPRQPAKAPPPRQPRSRYRRPVLWTVGVVFLASLLAGAWHFLGGRVESEEPPAAVTPPEPAAPAAPTAANALPFVVAIEAHRELLVALNRVTDLSEIEPELLFHVEPLEREGTMFYHVMAGPVPDSTAALALRDTLIARGHKTGPTPTDVRATPLAFLIGDYGTVESAQEQNDILRRLDIPGYVLQGTAADSAPLYRLYVGGFSTAAEAAIIRQMLQSAGIRDSLVTRTGNVMAADFISTEGDSVTTGDSLATRTGSSNP